MAAKNPASVLEEWMQSRPDSLAFSRLADLHRKAGNITQAIALCTRGLEKNPGYTTGRIILGRCYLEQENLDKAVEAFTAVCRNDRRNQVAMKMLADIFMRQGFSEKAGDLYSLLSRMDPHNETLLRAAAQNRGTGKSDLFEILRIDSAGKTAVDKTVVETPVDAPDALKETVEAPKGTQIASPQELGIVRQPPAAPAVDVTAKTELADVNVDEVLAEATAISGSDVTERMSEMFGENEAEATARAAAPPKQAAAPEQPAEEAIEVHPLTEVPDGSAISSRIDDLFGKDTVKMPAIQELRKPKEPAPREKEAVEELLPAKEEAAFEETMIMEADDVMKLPSESGIRVVEPPAPLPAAGELVVDEKETPPAATDRTDELVTDEILAQTPPPAPGLAGDLVIDAQESVEELLKGADDSLESLFEELPAAAEEAKAAPLPAAEEKADLFSPEDTVTGDDVAKRLEGIFEQKAEKENLTAAPGEEPAASAEEAILEPAAEMTVAMPKDEALPGEIPAADETSAAAPAPDDTITGDDVVERLDGIFEFNAKKAGPPSEAAGEMTVVQKPEDEAAFETAELAAKPEIKLGAGPSSMPGSEDTITGDDVVERLEGIFKRMRGPKQKEKEETAAIEKPAAPQEKEAVPEEMDVGPEEKRAEPAEPAFATETQTRAEQEKDAAEETDFPEETKDIISGADVEKRLKEIFPEDGSGSRKEAGSSPDASAEAEMTALFETPQGKTEDSDDTLIIGDLDDLDFAAAAPASDAEETVIGTGRGEETAPAEEAFDAHPLEEAAMETGIRPASAEDETLDAHPLEEASIETGVQPPAGGGELTETVAAGASDEESTAVFQEFTREMVPDAPPPAPDVPLFITSQNQAPPPAADLDQRDQPYLIPDHVITPTLADLYFQQGQPQLAIAIYERLIQMGGENPKYAARIQEIRSAVEQGAAAPKPAPAAEKPPEIAAPQAAGPEEKIAKRPPAPGRARARPAQGEDNRPLAGVRIKKRPKKLNWRKKRGENK